MSCTFFAFSARMRKQRNSCEIRMRKGKRSASVSLAAFGVPPNAFLSKGTKTKSAGRDAPHRDRDGRAPFSPPVKPASNRFSKSLPPANLCKRRRMKHLQTNASRPVRPSQTESNVAPVKLVGTRVRVPPVELGCSRRNTTSTASPRGGVGS